MPSPAPPIILDIEASGFGAGSYPIEVGVVLDDGRKYCALVELSGTINPSRFSRYI